MRRFQSSFIFFFASVISIVVAIIDFRLEEAGSVYPIVYVQSFYIGVSLLFIFSFLLVFINKIVLASLIIIIKFIIFVLIAYPFNHDIGFQFILLVGILVEAGLRIIYPYNLIISYVGSGVFFLFQQIMRPSDHFISGWYFSQNSIINLTEFIFFLIVVVFFLSRYKKKIDDNNNLSDEIARLKIGIEQLEKANVSFQQYADSVNEVATQKERKRITREIHDSSGYVYTNLIALIEVAISLGIKDQEKLTEILFDAKGQAIEGLRETRRAIRQLRETEDRKVYGIKEIIRILDTFKHATGIEVHLELGNVLWTYGRKIDLTIYRIIQESLTNSIRHGFATEVWIYFWEDGNRLKIFIRDNGKGTDTIEKGIGITSIEERIKGLNGVLSIPETKNGFHLLIEFPIREVVENDDD